MAEVPYDPVGLLSAGNNPFAPPNAGGLTQVLQQARAQLASQPQRFPTSYGDPQGDQAAMAPETFVNPAVRNMVESLATLPKRAIQNSQHSLDTGTYDPGPTLEAAALPIGTGAIAGVPMRAGEMALGAGPIRAYHGSPHDFDKFDLSKIGTGEGAQAYGHGLYFAENPKVAEEYADTLGKAKISNDDLVAGNYELGPRGHRYEANINADPEHFLDWEKPLNEQHPETQAAVKRAMGVDYYGNHDPVKAERLWHEFGSANAGTAVRQGFIASDDKLVADRLNQAGIPGIKYLDQGSRAAGDGSRNYVVFDHNLIDIARKYGMLGAIPAAGGAGFGTLAQQGQPRDGL